MNSKLIIKNNKDDLSLGTWNNWDQDHFENVLWIKKITAKKTEVCTSCGGSAQEAALSESTINQN